MKPIDWFKGVGALIVTIVTAVIVIWWLVIVAQKIGVRPEVDENGTVVLDEWSRAKDILIVVLPLFTATLAYWVGAREAGEAKEEASEAKDQLEAVIASSPEDILKKAKETHPDAFQGKGG